MRRKYAIAGSVLFLLLVLMTQVGLSTRQQSPSWDEGDHIYSGYMNWKHREYSLNPEHPPLVKLIATLPLLLLDLKIAPRQGRYFKTEAYMGGRELLFRNDPKYGGHYTADTLLFRIHMAVLVFALILALLVFSASAEMFGPTAGLIALTLFVFDPTILCNAPFVATDTAAACGFFAAVYTFYRFVKQMRWSRAILCGLATGLALASKHSAIVLLPMLVLLAIGELAGRWRIKHHWPRREASRLLIGTVAIMAISLFVLWGVYSFRFAMHPNGYTMPPIESQMATLSPGMQSFISFALRFHLLPQSYLYGLVDVQRVGLETPAYIFGKMYARGQWFYFPALLSLKFTIGLLGLLALSLYAFITRKIGRPREVFFLALPFLLFLAIAIPSPLNMGVRHVLPLFPFAFALAAAGAAYLIQQRKTWTVVVVALILWHVVDSLRMFPNYMPYANVLWGGPSKTHLYFTDSATDWAQQLKWTKQWLDTRNIHECSFAYFAAPFLLPSDYDIPCKLLPTPDLMDADIDVPPTVHGPVLVSFGTLTGFEIGSEVQNPYRTLFYRQPDDVIANGIAVYYGDIALPEVSAIKYRQRSSANLKKDPQQAVRDAQTAVALAPNGFDANMALGDAYAAAGNPTAAQAAYAVALHRVPEMEPSFQQTWRRRLEKKMADAVQNNRKP